LAVQGLSSCPGFNLTASFQTGATSMLVYAYGYAVALMLQGLTLRRGEREIMLFPPLV
jgi:hypothetical protein